MEEDEERPSLEDIDILLDTLQSWLHADTIIGQQEQDMVKLTVHLRNDAPPRDEGGEVVFIGVGLRISDGGKQDLNPPGWMKSIKVNRLGDRKDLRNRYRKGFWVSGIVFPVITDNEKTFGEILYPT